MLCSDVGFAGLPCWGRYRGCVVGLRRASLFVCQARAATVGYQPAWRGGHRWSVGLVRWSWVVSRAGEGVRVGQSGWGANRARPVGLGGESDWGGGHRAKVEMAERH